MTLSYFEKFQISIIRPVLDYLAPEIPYSKAAEHLLLGTAVQETRLRYLFQLGAGPALSHYQIEPRTHDDIWLHWLNQYQHRAIAEKVRGLLGVPPEPENQHLALAGNVFYATAMCRVFYRRIPAPLPKVGDVWAMAQYWKKYYNTRLGAGTVEEFFAHYPQHLTDPNHALA